MAENDYTFEEQSAIANIAAADIEGYLRSLKETISVINVELDRSYQKKDIDLIWKYEKNGAIHTKHVEIKGDTWYKTGNIFVETISNMTKNTPGCFLYTESDYIFYYFIDTGELNIIHMENFHNWWKLNEERFTPKYLRTRVRKNEDKFYRSMGRVVPKKVLKQELGMKQFTLPNFAKKIA